MLTFIFPKSGTILYQKCLQKELDKRIPRKKFFESPFEVTCTQNLTVT